MAKKKVIVSAGLGAVALTGLVSAKSLIAQNTKIEEKIADTLVDFTVNKKEPIKVNAAWSNPTTKYVYSGFEYVVVKDETGWGGTKASVLAKRYGTTIAKLRAINGTAPFLDAGGGDYLVYSGTLLFYKTPTTNYKQYYNKALEKPIEITTSNWKNKKSLSRSDVYDSSKADYGKNPEASGKMLGYSINENTLGITNGKLNIEGWAAQTQYVKTTGTNNQTKIVVTDAGTTNIKTLTSTSTVSINPKNLFIWNRAQGTSAQSLQCPELDAYLDRPVSFSAFGDGGRNSLQGCYHDYAKSGFKASVDLSKLFTDTSFNKTYDLYIVNSTGQNANRILYRALAFGTTASSSFTTSSGNIGGNVKVYGENIDVGEKIYINANQELYMRTTANGSKYHTINGLLTFPTSKNYTVKDKMWVSDISTLYYYVEGTVSGTVYKGWVPSYYVNDFKESAKIKLEATWAKFNVNYVSGDKDDKGTVIKTATSNTVNKGKTVTVDPATFSTITQGNIVWKLINSTDAPANVKTSRTFNGTTKPADVTFTYTKNKSVKINYINANTGEIIDSTTKDVKYGTTSTFKFSDLGTNNGGGYVTKDGVKYKYAGNGAYNVKDNTGSLLNINDSKYTASLKSLGITIDKYKNVDTQTRAYTNANDNNAFDEVNFYYYEPQAYTVNHARIDSNNKLLDTTGTVTTDIGKATVASDKGTYYTGDDISIDAYGIGSKNYTSAFGDYKFAGRSAYSKSTTIYDASKLASTDKNYKFASGSSDLEVGVAKISTTEAGTYANLYYRKAIADPSGVCDLTTNQCSTDTGGGNNPNTPGGTGTASTYVPKLSGQYNWYLSKDATATSANWKQSKLVTSNTGEIGNTNVYAVVGFKNTIQYKKGSSTETISSTNIDANNIYYSDLIKSRKVVKTVGDGVATATGNMNVTISKASSATVSATDTTILPNRTYDKLNSMASLNSYVYGGSESATAGKGGQVAYNTTYKYTNKLKDTYAQGDSYLGAVFTWNYEKTEPYFETTDVTKNLFNYNGSANVDHKLNEDSSTKLTKKGDSITSKIGIYRNFTAYSGNTLSELITSSTSNSKVLNEKITKTETLNTTLDTQTKLKAQETLTYQNDLLTNNGGLSTEGTAIKNGSGTQYVGFSKYANEFTYNTSGYNQYLMNDVDFNFRNVTASSNKLGKKVASSTTALENSYKYQTGLTATKGTVTSGSQPVTIALTNKYSVMSDSGLLVEGTTLSDTTAKSYYKTTTGYTATASDKLVSTNPTTSYYYIPIDSDSTLESGTTYTNRNVVSGVGLSDINVAVDNTFKFDNYLVGSTTDNTTYTSYKSSLSKSGDYGKATVITSKEADTIKEDISVDSSKNFRTLNVKQMIDKLSSYIGFSN